MKLTSDLMSKRIFSLDVFRGLAVLIMILVDAPPAESYDILSHSQWEGMTLADVAFPAFVFAMGASAAISNSRRPSTYKKIFRRAGLLFLIGIIFNELGYIFAYLLNENFTAADFYTGAVENIRVFGILQRLALSYLFGMLIVKLIESDKGILIAAFTILLASSAGYHIYAPENPFNEDDNLSRAVDLIFPGANHIYTYQTMNDPEGFYGTFSTTSSMLFGYIAGKILLDGEKVRRLLIFGTALLIIGIGWSFFEPIAKKIWTSPFALLNAGIDSIFTAMVIATPQLEKFLQPLAALGKSPLFFFLASNVILIILLTLNFLNDAVIFCWVWAALWLIIAVLIDKLEIVIKL